MPDTGIELGETGFDRGDVAQHRAGGKVGQHGFKGLDGVFDRRGIQHHVGGKGIDFVERRESTDVECEPESPGVGVKDGDIVVKGEKVGEEEAHLSGSEYEDFHK